MNTTPAGVEAAGVETPPIDSGQSSQSGQPGTGDPGTSTGRPGPTSQPIGDGQQLQQFDRARTSLRRSIARYGQRVDRDLLASLQPDLDRLTATLDKLDRFVVRIAAFGLVSRGKSAVLNALLGQASFETGPLNGVTRIPRSVRWQLAGDRPIEVELVDTPGLDEIGGETRAALSKEVAGRADLILFITAGDLTRVEFEALTELRRAQKPLILVFNKIDLYPETQRAVIAARLRSLIHLEAATRPIEPLATAEPEPVNGTPQPTETDQPGPDPVTEPDDRSIVWAMDESGPTATTGTTAEMLPLEKATEWPELLTDAEDHWRPVLPVDEVVLVAAEPSPMRVREEWPDGRVAYSWTNATPDIENLRSAILAVLDREGCTLLALNALLQARTAERVLAQKTITHLRDAAETTLWQTIRWKTVAIALSPLTALDLILGVGADLWSVVALAKLYGLPVTSHQLDRFWQTMATSSGCLILGELASWLVTGGQTVGFLEGGFGHYLAAALAQGAAASLGSVTIGRATRAYLEAGCTWGTDGSDTIARDILDRVDANTVLHRLRNELQKQLNGEGDQPNPGQPNPGQPNPG